MTNIQITKTQTTTCTSESFVYTILNFQSFRVITDSPYLVIPIPQQTAENTIDVKVDGNIQRVEIVYHILEEMCNVVTGAIGTNVCTKTASDQVGFLTTTLQPQGICCSYEIELVCPTQGFKKVVALDLTITEGHPVTWQATLTFVAGDVQTTICVNVPRKPPTSLAVACVTCCPQLTWTNTPVSCEGGSSISGYCVERRCQISDWDSISSCASTPFCDTTASTTCGAVYYYRVGARNTSGVSKPTQVIRFQA